MKAPARLGSFCFILPGAALVLSGVYPVCWRWPFHDFHHDTHRYDSPYSSGHGLHRGGLHP